MLFGLFGKGKRGPREEVLIGRVIHYFKRVKVAVIKVEGGTMSVGDHVRIKGHTTDFDQKITSMQIEHESVESVSKGQEAAIKTGRRARIGDQVFALRSK